MTSLPKINKSEFFSFHDIGLDEYSSEDDVSHKITFARSEIRRNNVSQRFADTHDRFLDYVDTNSKYIWRTVLILITILVLIHFIWATVYFLITEDHELKAWDGGYGFLIIITLIFFIILIKKYIYNIYIKEKLHTVYENHLLKWEEQISETWFIEYILYLFMFILLKTYIIVDCLVLKEPHRLRAFGAYYLLLLFGFIFSKYPHRVRLRPVVSGMFLQVILAIFMMSWKTGRDILKSFAERLTYFLQYSDTIILDVFGPLIAQQTFALAFKATGSIIFLSFCIAILYHFGAVHENILMIGSIMKKLLDCTIVESFNAAANIIFTMTECPLILQPYLFELTMSELHAVVASGFASISVINVNIIMQFGISVKHLLIANIMAAPCSLGFSKLFYPEIEESMTRESNIEPPDYHDHGIFDATVRATRVATHVVLNMIAQTIAFTAMLHFLNQVFGFYSYSIGIEDANLQITFGYFFWPICFLIGIPWNESGIVGELVSRKTISNLFVSYKYLGDYKHGYNEYNETVPTITKRSAIIATYALCGLSNPASVGVALGTYSVLCPARKEDIIAVMLRAYLTGLIVCLLNACIASLLVREEFEFQISFYDRPALDG